MDIYKWKKRRNRKRIREIHKMDNEDRLENTRIYDEKQNRTKQILKNL